MFGSFSHCLYYRDKNQYKEEVNMKKIMSFFKDEEGATAVEYGIMVALIAVVIILAVTAVGVNLRTVFNDVAGELVPVAGA
jgi:pilus assembly protein Flp/PilA